VQVNHATVRANGRKLNAPPVPSFLATGQNVASTTTVSQKDADVAVRAITGLWHGDTPKVHLAPTFSSLPKEVQDSVEQKQQNKTDKNNKVYINHTVKKSGMRRIG